MTRTPAHGFTKKGLAVHARTIDHHPTDTAYARFNKKVALIVTQNVGSMTCGWIFCVVSLLSLPAVLVSAHILKEGQLVPAFFAAAGFILVIAWLSQNFLQLVLLPTLMVGQNLQNAAADARAAKQFEDTEEIQGDMKRALDALNTETQGGLQTILQAIEAKKG